MTELDSLAIVAAIKHLEFYFYGAPVTVFTDHRACVSLLTSPHLNRRLKPFALSLQGQEMHIVYRPGKSGMLTASAGRIGMMKKTAPSRRLV